MKSGTVAFPNFRKNGTIKIVSNTNPPVHPIRNREASYPLIATAPAIEMNVAADIQSAAVAMPFANDETPPPAV